jgi:bacterioferritin
MVNSGGRMKGNQKVIEQLNSALSSELTAIVQYMVQAETLQSQGYERLGGLLKQRAIEEMHHAERLIERIVFFDSQPKVDVALTPQISGNVQQQLEVDFKDETHAIHTYNAAIQVCAEALDDGTKELFKGLLLDEEKHADFLEAQLSSMKAIGVGNYLAQQLYGAK